MNISPVSFGKTVRVFMPENSAYELANILNSKSVKVDEKALQEDAKEIFDDTFEGHAVVCSPDDGKSFYILSGNEASRLHDIRVKVIDTLEAICSLYEEGTLLDRNINYIFKRENQEVNNLISGTKESFILSKYEDDTTGLPRLCKLSIVG